MNNLPPVAQEGGPQGSANSKTLYPYADEQLGVFTSPGNTHPFNGSEADWAAFKKACEQRDQLESQLAQSEERVAQLEGALRVRIEASQHCLNKCDLLLGDSARMPGTFRGDLADRIRASKALLSSSKTN